MPYWVVTANRTVSGPFTHFAALAEQRRLIRLAGGVSAADYKVVWAETKEVALRIGTDT